MLGSELPCCCRCLRCGARCHVHSCGHIGRSRRGRRHLDRAQPAPVAQCPAGRSAPPTLAMRQVVSLAPPHSLHLLLSRWCWHRLAPPHSLHRLLWRWCWQMPAPPHSLHRLLWRWCGHRPPLRVAPSAVAPAVAPDPLRRAYFAALPPMCVLPDARLAPASEPSAAMSATMVVQHLELACAGPCAGPPQCVVKSRTQFNRRNQRAIIYLFSGGVTLPHPAAVVKRHGEDGEHSRNTGVRAPPFASGRLGGFLLLIFCSVCLPHCL